MVTITYDGLEHVTDKWLGNVSTDLDHIAVGNGTGNESSTADSLSNRVYSAPRSNNNVTFADTSDDGEFEARIRLTGGTEVSAGTDITEMALFIGDPTASGELAVIDEFNSITIEGGNTEELVLTVNPTQ